jgi:transposase
MGVYRETQRIWVRHAQVDAGERAGLTSEERDRLRLPEWENRELRRANEVLKSVSVFFATELDPVHRCAV